jgi:hypothetical protein
LKNWALILFLNFDFLFYIEIATTYRVSVITADEFGSGTNANVYIIIFGEHNDTGLIDLYD